MPEFLCNKVVDLEPATLFILKKDCSTSVYLWILRIFFRRPTFEENLEAATFGNAFLCNISGRLLPHFRGFNLCAEKILQFPVKPATFLTVRLF